MKKDFVKIHEIKNSINNEIDHYIIINEAEDDGLGQIYYYKPWKRWVAEFNNLIFFDDICLQKVVNFLKKLNN